MPDDSDLRISALEKKIADLERAAKADTSGSASLHPHADRQSLHPHAAKPEPDQEGGFTSDNARTATLERESAAQKVLIDGITQRLEAAEHLLQNVARVVKPTKSGQVWGSGSAGGVADWEDSGTC